MGNLGVGILDREDTFGSLGSALDMFSTFAQ